MIRLLDSADADHLAGILNHPSVHPWLDTGEGQLIEPMPFLDNPDVYALMGKRGGQIYHRRAPGLFEGHSAFLPEGRGRYAFAVTQETLGWMFQHTEAMEIVTRVPKGNLAAGALARMLGMQHDCTMSKGWVSNGASIPAGFWSLTIQSWMSRAPGLIERGKWFHDRLEAELQRAGIPEDVHEDDETHNRYVGAACALIFGGQPDKACALYNRVAMLAGWQPIEIACRKPLMIDIRQCLLAVEEMSFTVMTQDFAEEMEDACQQLQ